MLVHLERSPPLSALHAEHPATGYMPGTSFNDLRENEVGKVLRDAENPSPVTAVCTFEGSVTLDTVAIQFCLAKDGVPRRKAYNEQKQTPRNRRSRCLLSTDTPETLISRVHARTGRHLGVETCPAEKQQKKARLRHWDATFGVAWIDRRVRENISSEGNFVIVARLDCMRKARPTSRADANMISRLCDLGLLISSS